MEFIITDPSILPPDPNAVPVSVSPRQIREAMIGTDLIDAVEAAIAASDRKTRNWYGFATEFERHHPMVDALASSLNISEKQLDDLWRLAGSL